MILPLSAIVVVTGIGACVNAELAAIGAPVGRYVAVTPGAISWDTCDCNGMFVQTITRKNPTEVFPVDSSNSPANGGCQDRSFMWNIQAVILRCIHGLVRNGDQVYFPAPADLVSDSVRISQDEYALRKGIECCLAAMKAARPQVITDYRVAGTDWVGPEGNCGGVLISYSFQLV